MAKPKTKRAPLSERVKSDPGLLRRALKNPGLRSKLPARYLTKDQRQQRTLNVRLRQPIVAGSTTTERDLAREATAAGNVKYGPLETQQQQTLGEEQARQRDTGGFYDQYLRQVAQHSQNVQNIGAAATTAGLGVQQGITGLAGAGLAGVQNPAVADAQARGAQAGDMSQMANQAAAVRQALVGSFVAQQAAQNAAASNYAGTQANVVAPGQKLGAQAMATGRVRQARERQEATGREKGAFSEQFRSERRADEAKQVLARQTLGAEITESENKVKADERAAANDLNKYGYTDAEWAKLSEGQRNKARRGSGGRGAGAGDDTVYTSGAFAGRSKSEIAAMSPAERQKIVDAHNNKPGATDKAKGKGPEWLTPGQSGKGLSDVTALRDYAVKAKTGIKFKPTGKEKGPGTKLSREDAEAKIRGSVAAPAHPVLLTAALDAAYDRFLHNTTIRALIVAGYKPSEVARTLGVPTSGQMRSGSTSYNKGARGG